MIFTIDMAPHSNAILSTIGHIAQRHEVDYINDSINRREISSVNINFTRQLLENIFCQHIRHRVMGPSLKEGLFYDTLELVTETTETTCEETIYVMATYILKELIRLSEMLIRPINAMLNKLPDSAELNMLDIRRGIIFIDVGV